MSTSLEDPQRLSFVDEEKATMPGSTDTSEPRTEKSETSSEVDVGKVDSPRTIHGIKWALAYISILSTTFLFSLDNTIVAAIQPPILASLHDVELLPWIGTAFTLGSVCVLAWGRAYSVFDVKWLFCTHVILFEIGSAICGAAPTMTVFIIGRVIAGAGGSGMYVGSLTYIALLTSLSERSVYSAGVVVTWGIGSVLGPVIGGAFAVSSATWRWAFYINLVIGAVSAPAYLFLLPSIDSNRGKSIFQKLATMDWVSIVIFLGGSASFTMAIGFSGSVYAWNSGQTIALWVVTGVLLIAQIITTKFPVFVEKKDRLIPAHYFRKPLMLNLGVQISLSTGVIYAVIYYLALFFAFTRGDGPLDSGIRLLPLVCTLVFASIISGVFLPKIGYYLPWYVGGNMLVLIGSALMVTINNTTPVANIYGYTIFIGTGVGLFVSAGFPVAQTSVPEEDIPNSVAWLAVSQTMGIIVMLATSGSIMFNTGSGLLKIILPQGTSSEFLHDLMAGTQGEAYQSLDAETQLQVIPQITMAIRNVFILCLAGSALSFILSFFLERKKVKLDSSAAAI